MTYLDTLRDAIHKLHGAEATHVESVPVKEVFQGKTVWEGIVDVFDLKGHPDANRAYAWSHDTDDPKNPKRHVTVLHIHPALTPQAAIKVHILQELRSAQTA